MLRHGKIVIPNFSKLKIFIRIRWIVFCHATYKLVEIKKNFNVANISKISYLILSNKIVTFCESYFIIFLGWNASIPTRHDIKD